MTSEILAEISARLNAGRRRVAEAKASIKPQTSSKPPEAVSPLSVGRPSVERPELSDEDISKLSNEELDRLIQEEESRE